MKHSVGTKDNLYEKSYAGPPGNNCQRHGSSILQELDKFIFRKMNQKLQQAKTYDFRPQPGYPLQPGYLQQPGYLEQQADYLPGNQRRNQSQRQSQSRNRSQRQSITDYSFSYTR